MSAFGFLQAQAPRFGTFSPQYQPLEWKMMESRSADVYHHQGGAYLARFAAITLEESLKPLQRIFSAPITDKMVLIVYTTPYDALQDNSRTVSLPAGVSDINTLNRNRMVVSFTGDWYEFKRSIIRELTRGVMNTVFYGGVLPQKTGGEFAVSEWFLEGLAEYVANDASMTAETDMAMRDILLSDRFTTFGALEQQYRIPIGHAFFWYVGEKFGAGRISELISRLRGLRSLENAFRTTFGLTLDGFAAVWRRDMKDIFTADAASFEDADKIATRLTDTDKDGSQANSDPVWSPVSDKNGDKFAFLSAQGDVWQVMVQFEGKFKRLERVLNTGREFNASRAMLPKSASLLSWKPDGTQIAAVVSGNGADGVMLVNPTTGAQQRLEIALKTITALAFSPDGKLLALSAVENESPNLFLFDIAGKKLSKLTNDVFTDAEPTWSPDGKTLYFLSDRASNLATSSSTASVQMWEQAVQNTDIYAYSFATKKIERLTTTPSERKIALALSPDGKRLFYSSDRNGLYNLYDYNLVAKTITPRTNIQGGIREFGFTRGGAGMTFSAIKKGGLNIFTLQAALDRKIPEPNATTLRKQSLERESAAEKALGRAAQPSSSEGTQQPSDGIIVQYAPDTLRGYGKVDLTLENQKMVLPNPELLAQAARQQAVEENDFSTPGQLPSQPVEYNLNLVTWDLAPTFDTFFSASPAVSQSTIMGNFGLKADGLWMDAPGNHRLYAMANLATVLLNLNNNDALLSYTYLPETVDFEFQLFRTARENLIVDQREAVRAVLSYWGGSAKAMLPLSASMRLEGKVAVMNALRNSSQTRVNRSDFIVAPELRFVLDNAEIGYMGPQAGMRGSVTIDGVPGLGGLSFVRAIADFRQYIPVKNLATVAIRLSAGTNLGDTPQNFLAGGQENMILGRTFAPEILPLNRAEDLYFLQPVMPLRGFAIADGQGRNFAGANVEVRVPLLQQENTSSFLSSLLYGLQAVAFLDVGSAWTNPLRLNVPRAIFDTFDRYVGLAGGDLLMSFGAGLRTYIMGTLPVRIDLAWQNLQTGLMQPRFTVGMGYNF
ncbi:MAG: BamA/TamA family outer membrane protein [Candidatus Kapabacteria bacterium]|jgi:Tol biopolymer transport system component|nr:BamA/TamA family outer membrane protein [Candidatus Kapabacteria bacterium]